MDKTTLTTITMLKAVAKDAKQDAISFDNKPLNGFTIGTYFGNHGASIAALSTALQYTLTKLDIQEAKIQALKEENRRLNRFIKEVHDMTQVKAD